MDLYVRITVVEARRAVSPDSVGPALDRLAGSADSVLVRRALEDLRQEPDRWQYVLDAIAKRLHELEEKPAVAPEAAGDPDGAAPQ